MRALVHGYDELRLRIDRPEAAGPYRVRAGTDSAEASASFELPFSELEIENFILKVSRPRGRRRIDTSAIGDARRFGGGLFKALFREEIDSLYRETLADARSGDRGVRITLCLSGAPELIDVPWEYLFDDPDFLAVSAFTPVVRYLDLPRAHRPLLVKPPLRLLGVVSSPAEYEQLDAERERRNLERALSELTDVGAVELKWLERPTVGAMLRALQTETFHALHYIGHGAYDRDAGRGVLLFEDDSGWARPVGGDTLGMILHDFSSLRLAVLNSCEGARTGRTDPFAGVAGSLVQRDIPAVIAMQFEISDEAAIAFAGGFYRPLASGLPVDASLAAARLAMLAERNDDIEWGTPVLFMRVTDGRIFDVGEAIELVTARESPASATTVPLASDVSANQGQVSRRRRIGPALAAIVAACAAAGGIVAVAAGGGSGAGTTARRSGPLTVTYRRPWTGANGSVPGSFVFGSGEGSGAANEAPILLRSGDATFVAGTLAKSALIPGGPPPQLVSRYGRAGTDQDALVAGKTGKRYSWKLAGGHSLVAYVLATAASDLAAICAGPGGSIGLRPCSELATGVKLSGAEILPAGPDAALGVSLASELRRAAHARTSLNGRGGDPLMKLSAPAKGIADNEAAVARQLVRLAAPARYHALIAALAAAVAGEGSAFRALSSAAGADDRRTYRAAEKRVTTASRTLNAAVEAFRGTGMGLPTLEPLTLRNLPSGSPQSTTSAPVATPPPTTTAPASTSGTAVGPTSTGPTSSGPTSTGPGTVTSNAP